MREVPVERGLAILDTLLSSKQSGAQRIVKGLWRLHLRTACNKGHGASTRSRRHVRSPDQLSRG